MEKAKTNETLWALYLTLADAGKHVGVPYHTLYDACKRKALPSVSLSEGEIAVNIVDLTLFMMFRCIKKYRWAPQKIRVSEIACDPSFQPRTRFNPTFQRQLADVVREGSVLPPTWVGKRGLGYVMIEGHRRLDAHKFCSKETISAYILPFPETAFAAIAYEINTRHGQNLSVSDCRAKIDAHFAKHPEDLVSLRAGKVTQHKLAVSIGVSTPSLSRYFSDLKKGPIVKPDVHRIVTALAELKVPGDQKTQKLHSYLVYQLTRLLRRNWTVEEAREFRAELEAKTNPYVRSLPANVLEFVRDARGGRRVRGIVL